MVLFICIVLGFISLFLYAMSYSTLLAILLLPYFTLVAKKLSPHIDEHDEEFIVEAVYNRDNKVIALSVICLINYSLCLLFFIIAAWSVNMYFGLAAATLVSRGLYLSIFN